ncbi:TPA: hypothetical protein NID94_002298 [Pseudomonas aeruginosa]|nr:hypothetical protein [Pseudomonas aeruginosa]
MYTVSMVRKDFVSWLGEKLAIASKVKALKGDLLDVRGGEVLLVWSKKPSNKGEDAPLVVVPDSDLVDFFAFVSTYVGTYRPFSAFFNVVGLGVARRIFSKGQGVSLDVLSRLVSVVIAEAYVQIGGKRSSVSEVPVSACFGTFSDAVMQLAAYDSREDSIDELADRWLEARSLLGGETLALPVEETVGFWKLLLNGLSLGDNGHSLLQEPSEYAAVDFLYSVLVRGAADSSVWRVLTENLPQTRAALDVMDGSKEGRIRAFDEAVIELLKAELPSQNVRSLIVGYLAAKVGGGSFQYMPLAYDLSSRFKTAPLWFAVFSAFTLGSDYLSIGDCLGRRLVRERKRSVDFWAGSDSDISLDELRVIPVDDGGVPRTRRLRQSTIEVEIFPKVVATFRIGRRKSIDDRDAALMSRNREIRYLLDKASKLLDTPLGNRDNGRDLLGGRSERMKRT